MLLENRLNLFGKQKTLIVIVFILAFVLRFIYLIQISDAPYFDNPAGDSKVFFNHSQEILNGDIIGNEIYFYSSPLYPYFIAIIFWFSGNSFFFLVLIQILIGSANCLLIFFLAKKLSGGREIPAFIAGVSAALYGLFAFFDADLLMIFLTLVFINITLLLLIESKESNRARLAFLAGISFGLAVLDRTNILLFIPVAIWFLAGGCSFKWKKWKWKSTILFIAGTITMVFPITIRNYIVGHDFVLVSSNAGVNFFIGNNAHAVGVFHLPPESGLSNFDLHGTSVTIAENELSRRLKPSEISRFWVKKASEFIFNEPSKEISLLWRKFLLLWNSYEVPNNLSFYFVKSEFAPILQLMFIGFWLIVPLALVGIAWRWKQGLDPNSKLLIGFLITYMLSLMPFFITERYRLPMVPILIAFASVSVMDIFTLIKKGAIKKLIFFGAGLIAVSIFVNWHRIQFDYNRMRLIIGTRYLKRALENPQSYGDDIEKAIVELKWAVETIPSDPYAHYQLGKAYASIGFHSGAVYEWETSLKIDPQQPSVSRVLAIAHENLNKTGDLVSINTIPTTPYEEALSKEAHKQYKTAIEIYKNIIKKDPFHFQSYNNLGILLFERGKSREAIQVFKKGLKVMPQNLILLFDLAGIYYKQGELKKAKQIWERCLKIKPDCKPVLEALEMLER